MCISNGDFNVCKDAANQFFYVASWCYERDATDYLMNTFYPYSVNVAFACELYFKAIMIYRSPENEFSKGHDLRGLFDQLPVSDSTQISQAFTQQNRSKSLEAFLDKNRNTFIDWRYATEKPVCADVSTFYSLASILKDYVTNIS